MKTLYLNGLSKMMVGVYVAAIIFGPSSIAQFIADVATNGQTSNSVTDTIWGFGAIYAFCVCPFLFNVVTRRWRHVIISIVEK